MTVFVVPCFAFSRGKHKTTSLFDISGTFYGAKSSFKYLSLWLIIAFVVVVRDINHSIAENIPHCFQRNNFQQKKKKNLGRKDKRLSRGSFITKCHSELYWCKKKKKMKIVQTGNFPLSFRSISNCYRFIFKCQEQTFFTASETETGNKTFTSDSTIECTWYVTAWEFEKKSKLK